MIIHEKMFENRLFFCDKLQLMGAAITICDPHRAIVVGPRRLRGQRVDSPDIRGIGQVDRLPALMGPPRIGTCATSIAATSGSTNAFASSAPGSPGWMTCPSLLDGS